MSGENLIKQTCKELNLTYKQLGELIGYSEAAIKAAIAKNHNAMRAKILNILNPKG